MARIKGEQRERRKKMESIINLYKQEYDMVYENRLKRRKEQMKFNIRDIKEH